MIKYILKCKNKHEFESWFSSSDEYEKLKKKKLLECLFCESNQIEKSIMAPKILNSSSNNNIDNNFPSDKDFAKIKKDLLKIQKFVEKNFHFVGDNFAKEVKEIYYNKHKKNQYIRDHYSRRETGTCRGRHRTSYNSLD